ncbi:MAG: tRNA pseudouridine(55) synthase TruB [Balneolaceae bacterium]
MAKKAIPISDLPVINRHQAGTSRPEQFTEGAVVLIDKPKTWSSFHAVKFVRNRIPPKKVGHAGTLDPLATGLLILCTGKATKSISQFQELGKEYVADLRFGASTPSYDAALEPDETAPWQHINRSMAEQMIAARFIGDVEQTPPAYSAIKVKGERLYKKARRGESVEPEPRTVSIYGIEILEWNLPDVQIRVHCGKGTYIRSLAHELGLALGSRAYLTDLRRTGTGPYRVEDALTPEAFEAMIKKELEWQN